MVGKLASIDSGTIVVRLENQGTETVSRARATQVDVSAGTGACGGKCIGLCFLGGTAVGALAGFAAGGSKSDCHLWGLAYLVAVPAGAVLGMIVGAVVREEFWKSTPMPARLSVGPDGSGRFSFGLSVGF